MHVRQVENTQLINWEDNGSLISTMQKNQTLKDKVGADRCYN